MTIYQNCSDNADMMNRLIYYENLLEAKRGELEWQAQYIRKLEERIIDLHKFIDGLNGGDDEFEFGFCGDAYED